MSVRHFRRGLISSGKMGHVYAAVHAGGVVVPTYTPASSYVLGSPGTVSPDTVPPGAVFAFAPSSNTPNGWSINSTTGEVSTAAVTTTAVIGSGGKGALFGAYSVVVRMTVDGSHYDIDLTLKMVGNGLPTTNLSGKWLAGVGITLDGSGNVQSWADGPVKFDQATPANRPAVDADGSLMFLRASGTFMQSNINFIGSLVGNQDKHTFSFIKVPTWSIVGTNGIYGTDGAGYYTQHYTSTGLAAENFDGSADYAQWLAADGWPLFDEYMVVEQSHNPADELKMIVDGELKGQTLSNVTSLPGPTNILNLGCRDNNTQSGTFNMLAFLTYNHVLTANEQASVLSYLHSTFEDAL